MMMSSRPTNKPGEYRAICLLECWKIEGRQKAIWRLMMVCSYYLGNGMVDTNGTARYHN